MLRADGVRLVMMTGSNRQAANAVVRKIVASTKCCPNRGRRWSSADVKALTLARAGELRRRLREMGLMHDALLHLAERCAGDERPDYPILGGLAAVDDGQDRSTPAC